MKTRDVVLTTFPARLSGGLFYVRGVFFAANACMSSRCRQNNVDQTDLGITSEVVGYVIITSSSPGFLIRDVLVPQPLHDVSHWRDVCNNHDS
jgi:hypothetical protein